MFFNYVYLSFRKLWAQKSFSALNITGLSLATVSFALILMYVRYEKSYDDFRSASVYRVSYHFLQNNAEVGSSAQVVPAVGPAMKNDIPEVKESVRFAHTGPFMADPVIQNGNKSFRENRIYYADPAFLSMFSYHVLHGSAETALSKPNQVAVSVSTAKKYFGTDYALGKTLTFHRGEQGIQELLVTAVFEDVPANSHFHTDLVVSFSSLGLNLDSDWDWGNFYTYIEVQPGFDGKTVEAKIPTMLNIYLGKYIEEKAAEGGRLEFLLQPIHSIHLESHLWGELAVNGDSNTVDFLTIIAIFILAIAWVNYINFSIARSSENAKEISIRKISGSTRMQLIGQLLMDSALVNFIAMGISIALIQVTLPLVKGVIGLPETLMFTGDDVMILLAIYCAGTICSGLYPAYFISKLNPVTLLKSRISRSALSMNLNRALIVFQFTASIVMIIGTVTIYRQLNFMHGQDLGLNLDQKLIAKGPAVKDSTYQSSLSFFRNEIGKRSAVSAFAISSSIPGQELHWGRSFSRKDDPDHEVGCYIIAIDEKFFPLYEATFLAGNNFPDETTAYRDALIVNESAVRAFGYSRPEQIIGQTIMWDENDQQIPKQVIGVVKDFNQQSLRKGLEPIVFTLKKFVFAPWAGEFYSFKVNRNELESSIRLIDGLWKSTFAGNPFDYFFLDEFFNSQYKNDERFGKVFTMFSALAIIIACLGLFGLTSYMTVLRTKEIGVRKVLGSSASQLVKLLSRDFLTLVLAAFVLACPVGGYLMEKWLSQFAYRIPLSVWIFVVAGLLCFVGALLTVGIKSWNAANMDPTKALKYE